MNASTLRISSKFLGKLMLVWPNLICFALCYTLFLGGAWAQNAHISTYGTRGLIDMPSAEVLEDGIVLPTLSYASGSLKQTLTFQLTPRISGSFRYAILEGFDGGYGNRYDRSFDFSYQILSETSHRPALAVGLRDFGGTGIYSSEYLVATKHFSDRLGVTAGLGWGRLASVGAFDNPLGLLSDYFNTRGSGPSDINEVGQLEADQWFRGEAALFGGITYKVNDRLTFAAEYSSDAYSAEQAHMGFAPKHQINTALTYNARNGTQFSTYLLHGAELGAMISFPINPKKPKLPSGIDSAAAPLFGRSAAVASWTDNTFSQRSQELTKSLQDQGVLLEGIRLSKDVASVRVTNTRYPATAQMLGRAARVLANTLPRSITTFHIETMNQGMATTRTSLKRNDLEALEYDLDGSWSSFARARFEDASPSEVASIAGVYPKFNWRITPYLEPAIFDPDNPVRADVGLQFAASFEPSRGLIVSGAVRQPLTGNLDTSTRPSNSVLPHVRTDAPEYAKQSDLQIKNLTAEYFFRPGQNLYGRATAGYLETMYGGVSGEVLWKPVNGNLAFGAELNYAVQRDFDQLFGLQDYDIVTGHASAYYDFGGGYLGQLDVGRYLAGDYGATVSLDREFDNGFRVGAFFTLTDVPFDEFGEGSFDKGIRFSIPVDWLTGSATQGGYGTTIRPVLRDGGARLDVRNRLYGVVRGSHTTELEDRWGKFWR
jgi:hypothetical protein